VSDPAAIARLSDGVVFVVDMTRTKRHHAEDAVSVLNATRTAILGVVVNRTADPPSTY
jgi:Mrp family chromosome partitioning ATPase